jgi:aspartate/methionine/tyrosine aminotransferase
VGIDLGRLPLRYGFHKGRPDLRGYIAEQYPGLSSEHIIVTSGASEANFAIIAAVANPGDHVVIEHPNYTSMYDVPRSLGCDVSLLHLKFEEQFKPDIDELRDMITPNTKLVSLTHPNNPTGSMISEEILREIIGIVEEHNIYLLFDETYRELEFDKPLPPAASLSPKVISISSMSKCYGLPGIRIGWAATKDQFILDSLLAIREQVSITNNAISEEIATSVLKRKTEFLIKAKNHVEKNRAIVSAWMDETEDFEWIFPEAGVVSLPRIKDHVPVNPESLYTLLAEKYRTFVIPGRCFEMDNRYFRLGFGATHEEIKIGLQNITQALKDLTG